jgi:DNA polymerase III sliding clamp (beta) subunit (PCNA family)
MPVFLPKNLAALANVAARDPSRFAVNALRVLDLGGAYRVEATDGKKLAVVRGPCKEESYPALDVAFHGAAEVLVPVADWKAAHRLGGKERPVAFATDGTTFQLAVGNQSITGSAPDDRFPDFAAVLPRRPATVSFRVNPGLLVELLRAAAALEPVNGVGVLYYGPDKPVGLIAHNDAGQFFDGLLMPLT